MKRAVLKAKSPVHDVAQPKAAIQRNSSHSIEDFLVGSNPTTPKFPNMNDAKPHFGNKSDATAQKCACGATQSSPQTLSDALRLTCGNRPSTTNAMFRSTAAWFCKFFKLPPDEIPIDLMANSIWDFAKYLRDRRIAQTSIATYCSYTRRMIRVARKAGWSYTPTPIEKEWQPIVAALRGKRTGVLSLPRYAVRHGITPKQLTDSDLAKWVAERVQGGTKYPTAIGSRRVFCLAIRDANLESFVPRITLVNIRSQLYGVPLIQMPEPLRSEVQALLAWKQKAYVPNRPRNARIRKPTAESLENMICRVYGYATTIRKQTGIQSLLDLVTAETLNGFVEWSFQHRNVTGSELTTRFPILFTAMRQYFPSADLGWLEEFLLTIPAIVESERNERKDAKLVPYNVLADVTNKLEEERKLLCIRYKRSQSL